MQCNIVSHCYQDGQSPYGDATKDQILTHIDQLAPIFRDYDDVIDVVQVGFIGVWGKETMRSFSRDLSLSCPSSGHFLLSHIRGHVINEHFQNF